MDIFIVVGLLALGLHLLKTREQAQRIALLGSYLARFQIEKLLQQVLDGYQRALGEPDEERQLQVWQYLEQGEQLLREQFSQFAVEFAKVAEPLARGSRFPLALPFVTRLLPTLSFDMRKLLCVHAQGISSATDNALAQSPKRRAFTLMAELLLMQHSCHWFCRSRMVASARLLARQQTSYAQVLSAVMPTTQRAYVAVLTA